MTTQDLSQWIGRSETSHDRITHNLVKRLAATLSEPPPSPGEPLP
ncbi:TPA: transposase, partial [Pseudomonas putida]|nr:transposase [Pseudomonas putida]